MAEPLSVLPVDEDELALRQMLTHDLALLDKAARRLRWLGWAWFVLWVVALMFLLLLVGMGQIGAPAPVLVLGAILLAISLFYFGLARYVARGRRWAIGIALFLASVLVTVLLFRILTPRPLGCGMAVIESVYLVATLNLFKALIQGWGAARRLRQLVVSLGEELGGRNADLWEYL